MKSKFALRVRKARSAPEAYQDPGGRAGSPRCRGRLRTGVANQHGARHPSRLRGGGRHLAGPIRREPYEGLFDESRRRAPRIIEDD